MKNTYRILSMVISAGALCILQASDVRMAPMAVTAEQPEMHQTTLVYIPESQQPEEAPAYSVQESFDISIPDENSSFPLIEEEYSDYSYQEQPSESENFSEFWQEQE